MFVSNAWGPKRSEVGIQSPGTGIQALVNYHMESGIGLGRATNALDHWAISPASSSYFHSTNLEFLFTADIMEIL